MITWQDWVLISVNFLGLVLNIRDIGKPRKPMTANTAAGLTVSLVIMAWLIVSG